MRVRKKNGFKIARGGGATVALTFGVLRDDIACSFAPPLTTGTSHAPCAHLRFTGFFVTSMFPNEQRSPLHQALYVASYHIQ